MKISNRQFSDFLFEHARLFQNTPRIHARQFQIFWTNIHPLLKGFFLWSGALNSLPACNASTQWTPPSLLAISEKTERLPSTSMLIKEILFSIDCRLENSSYECRTLAKFFQPSSVFSLKKNSELKLQSCNFVYAIQC